MKRKTGVRIRVTTEKVYTAAHLRRYYPRAFKKALDNYCYELDLDYISDEMMRSLKGLCDAARVQMRDWSLGAYNRGNNLSVTIPGDDATAELSGPRAMAWIENNILGPLRAPWILPSVVSKDKKLSHGTHNTFYNVQNGRAVRRWTMPGVVKDCPFTGVCYDMDFLEDLQKSIRDGRTLKEAFEDLADLFAKNLEAEYEYQSEPAQFLETAESNGYEFNKEGARI